MVGFRKDILEELKKQDIIILVQMQKEIMDIISDKLKDKKPQETVIRNK